MRTASGHIVLAPERGNERDGSHGHRLLRPGRGTMPFRRRGSNSAGRTSSTSPSTPNVLPASTTRRSPPGRRRRRTSARCVDPTSAACASPRTCGNTHGRTGLPKKMQSSSAWKRRRKSFVLPAHRFIRRARTRQRAPPRTSRRFSWDEAACITREWQAAPRSCRMSHAFTCERRRPSPKRGVLNSDPGGSLLRDIVVCEVAREGFMRRKSPVAYLARVPARSALRG